MLFKYFAFMKYLIFLSSNWPCTYGSDILCCSTKDFCVDFHVYMNLFVKIKFGAKTFYMLNIYAKKKGKNMLMLIIRQVIEDQNKTWYSSFILFTCRMEYGNMWRSYYVDGNGIDDLIIRSPVRLHWTIKLYIDLVYFCFWKSK